MAKRNTTTPKTDNLPKKSDISQVSTRQKQLTPKVSNKIKEAIRPKRCQPTAKTDKLLLKIIDRIACGESLLHICQDDDMPAYRTMMRWQREDPSLVEQLDLAYELHARAMDDYADDILSGGIMSTGNILRDKERVAHLRWRLGKLNRKRYGDKQQVDVVNHEPFILDAKIIKGPGGDGV
ncbi:hypothetical protein PF049_00140 [Erythrobacteraceae bacterium WH01K]|nr:hypothetical protein PF049_00140 [Erythrobacteraceae bacterium WH01K]